MDTRNISRTNISLTEIGLGGTGLGNLYVPISDESSMEIVFEAWQQGIRYFDTAPHYGLGLSELRLGRALKVFSRDHFVISTKVGRLIEPHEFPTEYDTDGYVVAGNLKRRWNFSRDGILRSLEGSLERLQMDYVDIVLLHDPDVSGLSTALLEGTETLIELRDQGVVKAVGVGSNDAATIERAYREADIDVAMLAGRYSLLEPHGAERVFDAASGRSLIAAGVFNSGLLAQTKPSENVMYNYLPARPEVLARVRHLVATVERFGVTLPKAALAFPLRNSNVVSIPLGVSSVEQLRENVALYQTPTDESLWEQLESEGVL